MAKLNINGLRHELAKKSVFFVPKGEENNERLAATALKNISDLGFTLSQEGYDNLKTATTEDITEWYRNTVNELLELTGGNHEYKPFYPNFPDEVIEGDEFEMFIDQIAHYWLGYRPEGIDKNEGVKSLEEHPLTVLDTKEATTENIINRASEMFNSYLRTKQNLSNSQTEYITKFIECVPNWNDYVEKIENRQLLCTLYAAAIYGQKDTSNFPTLVTNDFLRIAAIANNFKGQNVDLSQSILDSLESLYNEEGINTLKSIPRKTRKFIVEGLSNQKNLEEDVARNKNQFKALFKLIHAGEYKNIASDKFNEVVTKVRQNQKLETFYGKVEKAFKDKDLIRAIDILKTRPGEFVKAINRILTAEGEGLDTLKDVFVHLLKTCDDVFAKARPEDLYNLAKYIEGRSRENKLPIHNVKGRLIIGEKKPATLWEDITNQIREKAIKGIVEQISVGKNWDKVYIEPNMYNMKMPLGIKDTSDAMKSYGKGSAIPIEKNDDDKPKNIRLGVWWTNTKDGKVDVDLSADFYSNETPDDPNTYKNEFTLNYQNMNSTLSKEHNCYHSGDITDGGDINKEGVAEFIDIDLKKLKEKNISFVRVYANIYSAPGVDAFRELPNCEFTIQERDDLSISEKYDIKAVKQHSKITTEGLATTPCIIDVDKERIIWIDEPDRRVHISQNINSQSAYTSLMAMIDKYCYYEGVSMGEIVAAVAQKIGAEIVDTPEKANQIFSMEQYDNAKDKEVITATDTDIWIGKFMVPQEISGQDKQLEKVNETNLDTVQKEIINSISKLSSTEINNILKEVKDLQTDKTHKTAPEKDYAQDKSTSFIPTKQNSYWDHYVNNADLKTREYAATQGYGLNALVNDESWLVRKTVADQGYGLDVLVNDESWRVRCAVAEQGYGLDILVNDKNTDVRRAVARQGYGLDILINDENWWVRCTVANQGYGLNVLVNDEDNYVRCAVARQGYGLDVLVNDKNAEVREAVADQGYGLDVLVNDEDWQVRKAVAEQGYGLDILINDKNPYVREEVANQGYTANTPILNEDNPKQDDNTHTSSNNIQITSDDEPEL